MAPPKHIGVHASWHEVSRILGLPQTSLALPLRTTCPLCEGRLSIYQDTITSGDWHYCFDCRHSGDMIELAAAVWEIPPSEAIVRLAHEGLPLPPWVHTEEAINTYIETDLGRRHQITDLWKRSQHFLLHGRSAHINGLRKKLGLVQSMSPERMAAGPARLFGANTCRVAEKAFLPGSAPNSSNTRVFKGVGWSDVLVVPYMSAPEHLAGMLFIGRNGGPRDVVMRGMPRYPVSSQVRRDYGLAGLELALDHPSSEVVATSDPFVLLRLHMRHFNTSLRPLPLVAWYADHAGMTGTAWEALSDRRIVLWENTVTPQVLLQCQQTEGLLALAGPKITSRQAIKHYLYSAQPMDLIRKVANSARPWREKVADWLKTAPEPEVLSLVHKLAALNEESVEILRECDPKHPLWRRPSLPMPRRVRIDSSVYIERNDRWYMVDKKGWERRLLNAAIRIDQVILRGQQLEYAGVINASGKTIPFRLDRMRSSSRSGPFNKRITTVAMLSGHHLWIENKTADLARIAMALHEPEIVKGRTNIGWSGSKFRFRHFSISKGQMHPHGDTVFPAKCPGPQDREYRLGKLLVKQLSVDGLESEVAWAVITSVAAGLLAAPASQESFQTILVGKESNRHFQAILERCGVGRRLVLGYTGSITLKWAHRWPIMLRRGDTTKEAYHRWIISSGFPYGIHFLEPSAAYVLLQHGGLVLLHCEEMLKAEALAKIPVAHALIGYLRHASGHLFRERDSKNFPWWERVQHDMARWLESIHGNPDALLRCRRWVNLPEDDLVVRMAAQLYRRGYLRAEGAVKWKRSVSVPFNSRGLLLTRDNLHEAIKLARLTPPDLTAVAEPVIVTSKDITG